MRKLILLPLLSLGLIPSTLAFQDASLIPWVTKNDLFRSRIIVNNFHDQEAEVLLVATRNDGTEDGAIRRIPPLGQLVEGPETLFPALPDGPGFAVLVTSDMAQIGVAFVINSQTGASGSSPAQADIVPLNDAQPILSFNYLPISEQGGSSAPVVVNLGGEEARVVFHAFQDGMEIGISDPILIASGRPFAAVTADLIADVTGDIFLVAESNAPLVGMAFIFNQFQEPSMANAQAIPFVPGSQ